VKTAKILALCTALAVFVASGLVPAQAAPANPKLMNPSALKEKAPETFKARFDTSKGVFVIEVTRAWAPNGADRFYNLVKNGYYDDCRFFRVVSGFMVQFGINGDPAVNNVWNMARIPDDPVQESNKRGMVTFATGGANTRTTQVFINYHNRNFMLDEQGFAPFGKVVEGMEVVDSLYSEYGDGPPSGKGPDQGRIQGEGNAYLTASFPNLDYIKSATIMKAEAPKPEEKAPATQPAPQPSK